jgi:electron transfer flavoprotein beta subunit
VRFIVCIKQVPDTTEVKIDPETNTLKREGVPSIINPFDKNALEAALQLKEQLGGNVVVISMGPPQAEEALREALAMGADEAVLLSDRAFGGADTLATSYTLAEAIKQQGEYDLVLFGLQAIDGDTGQVGPEVAEHLGIPQVTYVRALDIVDGVVRMERDDGVDCMVVEAAMPLAVTVTADINDPRLSSLRGKMRAKKADIPVLTAGDLGVDPGRIGLQGSPTQVVRVFTPPIGKGGEILSGSVEEAVSALLDRLHEKNIV